MLKSGGKSSKLSSRSKKGLLQGEGKDKKSSGIKERGTKRSCARSPSTKSRREPADKKPARNEERKEIKSPVKSVPRNRGYPCKPGQDVKEPKLPDEDN